MRPEERALGSRRGATPCANEVPRALPPWALRRKVRRFRGLMYLAERSNPSTSDAKRCTEFEGLKTEFPDLAANIRVEQGEANEELQR